MYLFIDLLILIGNTSENISWSGKYINDILSNCSDGLMILDYYKLHNTLSYTMRNLLSSVIIKNEFFSQANQQITKSKFIYLAKGMNSSCHLMYYYIYF